MQLWNLLGLWCAWIWLRNFTVFNLNLHNKADVGCLASWEDVQNHPHLGCSTKYRQAQFQILGLRMKEEITLPCLLPPCGGQPARDAGVQLIKNRIRPNGIGNSRTKNALQSTGTPPALTLERESGGKCCLPHLPVLHSDQPSKSHRIILLQICSRRPPRHSCF